MLVSDSPMLLLANSRSRRTLCGALALSLALLAQGCSVSNTALTNAAATSGPPTTASIKSATASPSTSLSLSQPSGLPADENLAKRPPVKVGLILPLSGGGQAAVVAESMKQAAELAIRDLGAKHMELLIRDDKGTPEGAMAAASDVVGQGAELVLGPLYSRSVTTVSAVAKSKNIPVVAFSNDRQVASSGTHLLSFLAGPEITRVVSYAASQGKRRYIALIPDDAYGKLVEPSFREAVARSGGSVLALATYPTDTGGRVASVLASVSKLRDEMRGLEEHNEPIDAIFIPGGDDTVQLLGPLLKQADIDTKRIRIIGTGALDTPNASRDDTFVGAWFAAPDPRGFKDFSDKFAKAYGHAPPRIASLAYDATSLAAALATGPDGARFIPSALTRPSGFNGVDGIFRLMSDGVTDRALSVLEVQKFGATVIDLAPTSLDTTLPGPSSALDQNATPRGTVSKVN